MEICTKVEQKTSRLFLERVTNRLLGALATAFVGIGCLMISMHGYDGHYLAVIAGGILSSAGFLLPMSARGKIVISVLSVLVTAFAFNFLLAVVGAAHRHEPSSRWVVAQSGEETPDRAQMARALGLSFDNRSRLEVMLALRELGVEAWPSISPRVLLKDWWTHYYGPWPTQDRESLIKINGQELMPIGGIANSFTVYCNENGTYVTYQSDERGFANPKGLWEKSKIDIAVVGDSFVHGGCVKRNEAYVGVVRQRYPLILNLGNDGIGPLYQLATIKEYLVPRRPKIVVWSYFCGNDLYDMIKERRTLLKNYLLPNFSQHLEKKQKIIDQALRDHVETVLESRGIGATISELREWFLHPLNNNDEWARVFKLSYVTELVQNATSGALDASWGKSRNNPWQPPVGKDNLEYFRTILAEAKHTVNSWGGKLVFIYLPRYERYTAAGGQPDRDNVLNIVKSLGIDLIDMHPVFAEAEDPLELFPLRLPTHYSPAGYRLVGEQLLKYLDHNMDVKLTKADSAYSGLRQ